MFFVAAAGLPCNIHPVYALSAVVSRTKVVRRGNRFRASATIGFGVREVRGATIVTIEPGVLNHVRGHQIIAERVARSSNGQIVATGSSVAQARARLADTVKRMTSEQNGEMTREERAYDDVTQNGAEQSQGPAYGFPGGSDVTDPGCTH